MLDTKTPGAKTARREARKTDPSESKSPQAARETVESIVIAVILAFLFRGFVAEAFVIPTGSMASTLQGRHMDVRCKQCGFPYRTGASSENRDSGNYQEVTHTVCPMCRYVMELQKDTNPNQRSFNGDRILVSKFAYLLAEPQRWDVIVFKYPGNAKQNYIKRLIGLPGETIRIRHGDIYVARNGEGKDGGADAGFRMARKPPGKVQATLQLVYDTAYPCERLNRVGWPSRWQPAAGLPSGKGWVPDKSGKGFQISGGPEERWLRYHHIVPWPKEFYEYPGDWDFVERGELPPRVAGFQGQLITDYYEYNDFRPSQNHEPYGTCWVGDLAVECSVRVQGQEGELLLDLVEGGTHYGCKIDVATGRAQLSIDNGKLPFTADDGRTAERPSADTAMRRPGYYRVRFANVDDQLLLWVNERLIPFDGPTTYRSPEDVVPRWSPEDPGDLTPVGVGSRQATLEVDRLRVLRDIYYLAVKADHYRQSEYEFPYAQALGSDQIAQIMADPRQWSSARLFGLRRTVEFRLEEDQFFPMGDNSPQSKDARLWSLVSPDGTYHDPPPFVERDLLIGKALLIYWPHAWRTPLDPRLPKRRFGPNMRLPLLPNLARIGLIR